MNLIIDEENCIGCGLCESVCIRENIKVDDICIELDSGLCFNCCHCMAVCPKDAIIVKKYENQLDKVQNYNQSNIPVSTTDLLDLFKQRRSIRWFKDKKIDKETLNKLFEVAYYSPSAENKQDVEFVVIEDEERLNSFMELVYDIIKVKEKEFFRIQRLGEYLKNPDDFDYHPLLWSGKQLILGFATIPTNAVIAATRIEVLAYTMGLGGFYSLWMLMADEIDHDKLMKFFPEVPSDKHLASTFVIGYPKVRYRKTLPHDEIKITYI